MVTKSLNGSLSNRPWTDPEAAALKEGGEPVKGKWTLLDAFSLLVLNKNLLKNHAEAWTDDDIIARSRDLAIAICEVWPGPAEVATHVRDDAATDDEVAGAAAADEPWSDEELRASVRAYREIAEEERSGRLYSKGAIRERVLAGPLRNRSVGSFEYRMANISAVLDE